MWGYIISVWGFIQEILPLATVVLLLLIWIDLADLKKKK